MAHTLVAAQYQKLAARDDQRRSVAAQSLFSDLMAIEPEVRRGFMAELSDVDMEQLLKVANMEGGTPYALYRDDPVGFVEDVLGESSWSLSNEVLRSIPVNKRTAVPSCFGSSKTWGAARAALWFSMVYPAGTALTVTIAPLWRQVQRQMWPEIRKAHKQSGLPGVADMTQLKIPTKSGQMYTCAYGIAANPYNEAAVQGIHAPNLLLVVDEGGGIGHTIGRNLRALQTGSNSRMLVIGNPPSDDEGSWFEKLCTTEKGVNVIRISAYSTPNFTDEKAPRCRSCPEDMPLHPMSDHMVDQEWVDNTLEDFDEESPFVQAKLYARFPKGGADRALPSSWLENAMEEPDPDPRDDDMLVRIEDLDLPDEEEQGVVRRGAWIRLGVDVAADGGDELAISRSIGDLFSIRHTSSGESNANPLTVAGKILQEILKAQALAKAIGTEHKIRVKIDGIGVGWGVAGTLTGWGEEGLHQAEIVVVNVSEKTNRDPEPNATFRPALKRDEMWLSFRDLLPRPKDATSPIRLRVDRKTMAQLAAPKLSTAASGGATKVEGKKSLKARGLNSPDRGESILLCAYEPAIEKRKTTEVLA